MKVSSGCIEKPSKCRQPKLKLFEQHIQWDAGGRPIDIMYIRPPGGRKYPTASAREKRCGGTRLRLSEERYGKSFCYINISPNQIFPSSTRENENWAKIN